ncbi:MAG: hypothetical protein AAFR39_06115 [Pseudomonadota bacterium]
MTETKKEHSIGTVLGVHLALFEEDLVEAPDDLAVMEKIRLISEAYKNFATGGLSDFMEDFETGYKIGKRDVHNNNVPIVSAKDPSSLDFDGT